MDVTWGLAMAVNRQELILKSVGRLVDEALAATKQEIQATQRAASSTGSLNGGTTSLAMAQLCELGFQKACISALEKVQLEDREGALELAELVRTKILKTSRPKFVEVYTNARVGPRPAGVDLNINSRFKAQGEIEPNLRRIEANAVEEFQLAVTRQSPKVRAQIHTSTYVHLDRVEELKAKTSIVWDFSRLLSLCEELNTAWQYGSHHSVAMLSRALLDHVPPIFGQKTFAGVSSSYAGSRSFKEGMESLDRMSRKIADGHLHTQIRDREALPNANQVDFRPGIDLLLSEIVRIVP